MSCGEYRGVGGEGAQIMFIRFTLSTTRSGSFNHDLLLSLNLVWSGARLYFKYFSMWGYTQIPKYFIKGTVLTWSAFIIRTGWGKKIDLSQFIRKPDYEPKVCIRNMRETSEWPVFPKNSRALSTVDYSSVCNLVSNLLFYLWIIIWHYSYICMNKLCFLLKRIFKLCGASKLCLLHIFVYSSDLGIDQTKAFYKTSF